ncbi:MAG: hypothetical protein F6K21_07860 [Symploca sp. SIO2D2]|nr:hypothetical protein [Symploca sp. SIO2D2]
MSHQPKLTAENQTELEELGFTLEAFQGQFLLIFAQCNYDTLRSRLIQLIQESSPLDIHTITLHPNDTALYQRIQRDLQGQQPQALMVLGLESVQSLEKMLASADLVREEFRNNCPFPVVVWVTDSVKSQWMQFARNLESWGVSSQFNLSFEELVRFIQDKTTQCLEDGLDLTKTKWLELKGELEAAAAELQLAEPELEPAIAAALFSLLGICHKQQADYQQAIDYFEQALVGWQELDRWDYQGLVLTEIVDGYLCHINQITPATGSITQQHKIKVKDYLQQALTAFYQAQRPDLIADALRVFGEVLRELQDWQQLQDLAQQALAFDQGRNRQDKLAIDYLFLADVALAQKRWQEARELAVKALKYSEQSLPLRLQSRCYWILAQSYRNLGQLQAAIAQLKSAHNLSEPLANPRFYLEILGNLNELYWQNKDYLPAFKIKQEQQTVETQLGLRAFIGASRIPSPVGTVGERVNIGNRAHVGAPLLAPEITASGREKDVRELVERVIRNDCKVIVIQGFSGVGKSSLVNAGLVPTLRQTTASGQCIIPILIQVYTDWLQDIGQQLTAALARQQIQITQPLDSTKAILETLRQTKQQLSIVLIFDQFEEFFFVVEQEAAQNQLLRFLGNCLNILSLKVIFSLRRDYLHHLLDRPGMDAIGNDILSKRVLYRITNFTTSEAHSLIEQLTAQSHFKLESALIEQLVEDLAGNSGKVRPIELQIVGAQLQAEGIRTLVDYQRSGTKEKLVLRYLAEVVQDCGEENKLISELLLYLLTDEKERRLLKTRAELAAELKNFSTVAASQLDLILEILVLSGLIFAIPDTPDNRYQLVHDYLVSFIRQPQEPKIIAQLNQEREQRQKLEENIHQEREQRQELEQSIQQVRGELTLVQKQREQVLLEVETAEQTKQKLAAENRKASRRVRMSSGFSILTVIASVFALTWTGVKSSRDMQEVRQQEQEARQGELVAKEREKKAKQGEKEALQGAKIARQQFAEAQKQVSDARQELKDTEKREEEALQGAKIAKQQFVEAQQRVVAAQQRESTAQQNADQAQQSAKVANRQAQVAKRREQEANEQVQLAQGKVREADKQLQLAQTSLAQAEAEQVEAQKQTEVALKGTELEQRGTLALRQFNYTQIPSLISAMQAGQDLKKLVKDQPIDQYPAYSPISALQQILAQIRERNQLRGHTSSVNHVAFSPDGRQIASASGDGTVRLWSRQGEELAVLRHRGEVTSVEYSPDGKRIASTSYHDNMVRLWSSQGKALTVLRGHEDKVNHVAFSPDGRQIASVSRDNKVRLWSSQGEELDVLYGHQKWVTHVEYSPDGKQIASASDDKTVWLWDSQGEVIEVLRGHKSKVTHVAFSPDGKRIASASGDKTVRLWNSQGKELAVLDGHEDRVMSVAFSPDGKRIASASKDNTVRLWSRQGEELAVLRGHDNWVKSVEFSPDGKQIASASSDGTVRLWSRQGKSLAVLRHRGGVTSVEYSPDGRQIASASGDKTVRLWNSQGEILPVLRGHEDLVMSVEYSPDGKQIASASNDKTVRLWNSQGKELAVLRGHQDAVMSVEYSPDGRQIASASVDKTVRLWSRQGEALAVLRGHEGWVWSVEFSPDGRRIASASKDKTVRLWSSQGEELAVLRGHEREVTGVKFSPDGKRIVSVSNNDKTMRLWSSQGKELAVLPGYESSVRSVKFSPDGRRIAIVSNDKTMRLWNSQGEELAVLPGDKNRVSQVKFSPDGKQIAGVSSHDNTVILWSSQGEKLAVLRGHEDRVGSVEFSPDGRRIASASQDNTVRLWSSQGEALAVLHGDEDRVRNVKFRPDGRQIAIASRENTVTLWPVESLDDLLAKGCNSLEGYLRMHPDDSDIDEFCAGIRAEGNDW